MQERQREFEFMEEMQDRQMLRCYGQAIAQNCLEELRQPLRELVREEVSGAIADAMSRERGREGVRLVDEDLKDLFKLAMQQYFEPIRDDFERIVKSCRRDEDDADWWKRGGSDDDDE